MPNLSGRAVLKRTAANLNLVEADSGFEPAWSITLQNETTHLTVADTDGDGVDEIAVSDKVPWGSSEFGLIKEGDWLWQTNSEGAVSTGPAADVDGDGVEEIIMNGRSGLRWVRTYSHGGSVLWQREFPGLPGAVSRDVDTDGKAEIMSVAPIPGTLVYWDDDGTTLLEATDESLIDGIRDANDFAGDGSTEFLLANDQSVLSLAEKQSQNSIVEMWAAGPSSLQQARFADLDNGERDVVATYDNGEVHAFDQADGTTLWTVETELSGSNSRIIDRGGETFEAVLWSGTDIAIVDSATQEVTTVSIDADLNRVEKFDNTNFVVVTTDYVGIVDPESGVTARQPISRSVEDLGVGDIDGDGQLEVLVGYPDELVAYNRTTPAPLTPETTRTPTQATQTQLSAGSVQSRLRDANRLVTVTIEGREYYVLNEIPNQPDDQYAFTTTDYELLEPAGATDVAVSHSFCEAYQLDAQDRLDYTTNQYEGFDNVEEMARAANLLSLLSGALAMAAIDPKSAISPVFELSTTALDWAQRDSSQPYYEQFAKIATTSSTLDWAEREVSDPNASLLNVTEDAQAVLETTVFAAETADLGADIADTALTVRDIVSKADSLFRTDVDTSSINGADDFVSSSYTILAGIGVTATVSSVVNVAEAQAKAAAMGRASAAVRRPLLHELITLENRANDYRIGPAGILRMQALQQVDYQIEAAAWSGINEIYSGLSSGILGPAYDAFLGADDFAASADNNASAWQNLSHYTMVSTGEQIRRGLENYEQSLNRAEFGQQGVLDRQ